MIDAEWDEQKAATNLARHGIPFSEAAEALNDLFAFTYLDIEQSQEEERWITIATSSFDAIFPLTTPEGDVLPKYSAAQIRYIKEDGVRGRMAAKIAAARANGTYYIQGLPEAEYWATHPRPAILPDTPEEHNQPDTSPAEPICVTLAPDIAAAFPTTQAVNDALRRLLSLQPA